MSKSLTKQGSFLSKPANKLLNDFGLGKASPGSGSAAALMGLLSAKLISTVCKKSLEKPECKKDEKIFSYLLEQIETSIVPSLEELFEKDARDFARVVELRELRDKEKNTKKKSALSRESNDLLETATNYTFEIVELCMTLIDHAVVVFENGWHAVRGDSGAAISAAISGVMSGIFIINLNLKTLKDRNYSTANIGKCQGIYDRLYTKQTKAFSCVTSLNTEAIEAIQLELKGT